MHGFGTYYWWIMIDSLGTYVNLHGLCKDYEWMVHALTWILHELRMVLCGLCIGNDFAWIMRGFAWIMRGLCDDYEGLCQDYWTLSGLCQDHACTGLCKDYTKMMQGIYTQNTPKTHAYSTTPQKIQKFI